MFDTKMLIGDDFVAGTETPERVLNPKTEDVLLDLPEASVQQVYAAVNAAEEAFSSWSRTTPAERSGLLLKLADAIEREGEAFAGLEALTLGRLLAGHSRGRSFVRLAADGCFGHGGPTARRRARSLRCPPAVAG